MFSVADISVCGVLQHFDFNIMATETAYVLMFLINKKLSYRRGTTRRAVTVRTVLNVAQMFVKLHLISPALGE